MPNRIYFFSDIDDTLIQTKRKTDFTKNTIVGAYNREGAENSFFYEGTKLFIDTIINSGMNFIPTTARNFEAYKRTVFYDDVNIQYAILNFGGSIIINNKIDNEWANIIEKKYNNISSINSVYEKLIVHLNEVGLNLVVKIIDNFYISIYNKENIDDTNILSQIREVLNFFVIANSQLYIYENDNSFGILPSFLNKKFAVEYLINKHNPILTIGAGDNISDLDFMKLTTFKLLPEKYLL
jgi:hypothetical protein